ncbi:IS3 family transposase [Bacillus cereus]
MHYYNYKRINTKLKGMGPLQYEVAEKLHLVPFG